MSYIHGYLAHVKRNWSIVITKLCESSHIIFFLVIIKVLFFVFGCFFYLLHTNSAVNIHPFLSIFYRWDVRHYLTIAERGYTVLENGALIHIVFPPLWPLLIYLVNSIFHNTMLSGLLLANLFSLLGGIILYLVLKKDYGAKVAFHSTLLLFIFPTAFYLHIPYTEALFFFLVTCFFYALRSHNFLLATLFGCFASATRVMGFLLIVPYLAEYYATYKFSLNKKLCYIFLILSGFGVYLLLNYYLAGDFFAFIKVQREHWTRKNTSFMNIPVRTFYSIKSLLLSRNFTTNGLLLDRVEPFFSLFAAIILLVGRKILRASYFCYGMVNLVFLFSQSFWLSNTRYILMIFPLFIILAGYLFSDSTKNYRVVLGFCYAFFCIMLLSQFFSRFMIGHMTAL